MKILNSSIKSSAILISLALLSAGTLANNNTHLNFDYTRGDDINLDPRLGVQANGCLTKSVPLKLKFRFQPGIKVTDLAMSLEVRGDDWRKGYTIFSPSVAQGTKTKSTADKDLLIPWLFSTSGTFKMLEQKTVIVSAGAPEHFGRKFCFSLGFDNQGYGKYPTTWGFAPIFDPTDGPVPSYAAYSFLWGDRKQEMYDHFCKGTPVKNGKGEGELYNWGVEPRGFGHGEVRPTPEMENKVKNFPGGEDAFLTGQHFFESHSPATQSVTKEVFTALRNPFEVKYEDKVNVYDFRFAPQGVSGNTYIDPNPGEETELIVTLANRNISAIILTIDYGDGSLPDILRWEVAENDFLRNWLRKSQNVVQVLPRESDNSDSYKVKNFYRPGTNEMFKGSLASAASLNKAFENFVRQAPLTIPPQVSGDFNLINTESLTFNIGRQGSLTGPLNMNVYGEPLRFGPMIIENREVISAAEMSRLCN